MEVGESKIKWPNVTEGRGRKRSTMKRIWQRLHGSPAVQHEYFKLELPMAWEPSDSSRSSTNGEGKETPFGFSHGNQNAQ
jgi:hypothetical protein